MTKSIKKEIEKFLQNTPQILVAKKEKEIEKFLREFFLKKEIKTTLKIHLKNNTIIIKTKSPSWRQELLFFKKEIIQKINKKLRNYTIEKVVIL